MPINPSAPPPVLKDRVATAISATAHRNRKSLTVAAIGLGMFMAMIAMSVTFGVAFFGTAAFLGGAVIQHLVTGAK